jgi:O-antigen ligase
MVASTAWTSELDVQRQGRVSVFWLLLRVMACFVLVANFFTLVQVGPLSLLGYATVVILLVTTMALAFNIRGVVLMFRPLFLWGTFVVWLCLTFVISGIVVAQPPIANISLIAIMALSGVMAWAVPSEVKTLHTILRWAFVANAGISMVLLALTGLSGDLLGPRTCAITAVLGLGITLSYWRRGHRAWLFVSLALVLVPLVTLSRTAAACGLVLFPISGIPLRQRKLSWTKMAFLGIAACVCLYSAMEMFPELQNRFFFGGRTAKDFVHGNATLDTSGRAEMWAAVIDSWSATPQTMWIGRGAGSSEDAASEGVSSMSHPHNDYLALLHDYGIIGFSIFVLAYFKLIWGRWKTWGRSESAGSQHAIIHSAAFLMALAMAIMMITDNPLEYMFAILPTALVVGSSIGLEANENSQESASPESSFT